MILNHAARAVKSESPRLDPFDLNRRILGSSLSLAEKAVLIRILDHARYGTSQCTASTRTLARETRVTERHVRTVLIELERIGYIVVERVGGSQFSRHVIRCGPCLHQVGTGFSIRLYKGGTDFSEGGTSMHRAGESYPCSPDFKSEEKSGFSPPSEEMHPETQRWFGHLIDPTA